MSLIAEHLDKIWPQVQQAFPPSKLASMGRADLSREIKIMLLAWLEQSKTEINILDQRDLVTTLVNRALAQSPKTASAPPPAASIPLQPKTTSAAADKPSTEFLEDTEIARISVVKPALEAIKTKLHPLLMERMDTSAAAKLDKESLFRAIGDIISDILNEQKIQLNTNERQELVRNIIDDMTGLGPLEVLLADETVSEIMVNGPKQVYIESKGRLTLTDIEFRDNAHVLTVATRIVTAIGRRIDESTPLCDARLLDGSRVNIIIPPLAIDGPSITIRKFSKKKITLDVMVKFGSISEQMAKVMKVMGRARLNILISGGTGSGKTTLLNALSQQIDMGERIVTIEDAAELQLQQPHVVRLETRPANLEGHGEISMRELLKNSLRMRPDRIILGECRGGEAIDMLQAMNTGHDGSLSTVHANRPREAVMRLENMVGLGGVNLAPRAIRQQIASAVDAIIQVARMRDGGRRITHISEVIGMEGEVITMQDLFTCEIKGEDDNGKLVVEYKYHGHRPHFLPKAAYYGLEQQLMEILAESPRA